MALKRTWIPSPNYSSRGGSSISLIVLHTAQGARTYRDLGAFFSKSSAQVSSQVGIDDTPNEIGEYVVRGNKSWTQAGANPISDSAELCAFAEWDKTEWQKHPVMLQNTAQWIAEEAKILQIPLIKLSSYQAQHGYSGVCQHVDLGSWGGGHWDCGPNFPIDQVLEMAQAGGVLPTPITNFGADDVFITSNDKKTYWLIYNGAQSYWRQVPDNLVQNIPTGQIIQDPNGSWKNLWKVGAN